MRCSLHGFVMQSYSLYSLSTLNMYFIHQAVESRLSQNAKYPANTEQSDMQTEIEEFLFNIEGIEVRTVSTSDKLCKV